MPSGWFFFMDLDGGSPYILPTDPLLSHSFGGQLLNQIGSFVDSSLNPSRYYFIPGSLALQEAFNCLSKFAGALLFLFSCGSSSNLHHKSLGNSHSSKPRSCKSLAQSRHNTCRHNFAGLHSNSRLRGESAAPVPLRTIASVKIRQLFMEVEHLQPFPMLSLAAAFVPPFDKLSSKVLAVPLENTDVKISGHIDQAPCLDEHRGCAGLSFPDINWTRHVVEPRTGIEFPTILDNILAGDNKSSLTSEVLVGTGSRTIRIIKIKSLKVYAFGLYVDPHSVCEKLGPKYASIPFNEINNRSDFFMDLLREDIHMTVRLVVNCDGLKLSTVRDAFEKSLRARLLKMNPSTDYHCLEVFRSYFSQDIPLPAGTTIDFRRTADGQLITEFAGKQMRAVHSKELCRAFFDMYIGDLPVSVQAKEEIGRNVATIIRRC